MVEFGTLSVPNTPDPHPPLVRNLYKSLYLVTKSYCIFSILRKFNIYMFLAILEKFLGFFREKIAKYR